MRLYFLSFLLLTSCIAGRTRDKEHLLRWGIPEDSPSISFQNPIDSTWDKDAVWNLSRDGVSQFYCGCSKTASYSLGKALEAQDYFSQQSDPEIAAMWLGSDALAAFQCAPYEEISLRLFHSFSLFEGGDEENGIALLKQAERREQELLQQPAAKLEKNALTKYLLSIFLQRDGDFSNASILYKESCNLIKNQLPSPALTKGGGCIIVLIHQGLVPYKKAGKAPLTSEVVYLIETLWNKRCPKRISSLPPALVPYLHHPEYDEPKPVRLAMNGRCLREVRIADLREAGFKEWKNTFAEKVARAYVRILSRKAAVEVCNDQDPFLGNLADALAFFLNLATGVDLRSFSTLPAAIDMARIDVSPGIHCLTISDNERCLNIDLEIEENQVKLIHVVKPSLAPIYQVRETKEKKYE